MKIRVDFVTNSSSSSFILGFKDKQDLKNFKHKCKKLGRKDIIDLIDNDLKRQTEYTKERLIHIVQEIYSYNYRDEVLEALEPGYSELDFRSKIDIERKYRKTEEYDKALKNILKDDVEYNKTIERIAQDNITVYDLIWDTDDTEPENSIREGIFKTEFQDWLIVQHDIG